MRLLTSASATLPEDSSLRIFGELVMKLSIVRLVILGIQIQITHLSARSRYMTTFSS